MNEVDDFRSMGEFPTGKFSFRFQVLSFQLKNCSFLLLEFSGPLIGFPGIAVAGPFCAGSH